MKTYKLTPASNVDAGIKRNVAGLWRRFYVEVSLVAALFIAYSVRSYATHPGLYVALSTFLCDVVLFRIARFRIGMRLVWVALLNWLSISVLRFASDRIELDYAVFIFVFTCVVLVVSFSVRPTNAATD